MRPEQRPTSELFQEASWLIREPGALGQAKSNLNAILQREEDLPDKNNLAAAIRQAKSREELLATWSIMNGWFRKSAARRGSTFHLRLSLPSDLDDETAEEVGLQVRRIIDALSALHRLHGGSGLRLVEGQSGEKQPAPLAVGV